MFFVWVRYFYFQKKLYFEKQIPKLRSKSLSKMRSTKHILAVPATIWIPYVQRITLTSTFYQGTFNKYLFLNYSMTFANVCFTFSKYSFTCPIRPRFQILLVFFILKILYFILINMIFTIGSWCWTSCLRLLFQKA